MSYLISHLWQFYMVSLEYLPDLKHSHRNKKVAVHFGNINFMLSDRVGCIDHAENTVFLAQIDDRLPRIYDTNDQLALYRRQSSSLTLA